MKMLFENHNFATTRCMEFRDVTDDVLEVVRRSQVSDGMALIYSPHTTCSIVINESESGFKADFEELVQGLVSQQRSYRHDDMSVRTENVVEEDFEFPNGHAHCKTGLIASTSQAIPIVDSALQLGQWQRIFFLELDRARQRRVLIQVMGE